MKVKTKIRLKRIVVILLFLSYCFWVEYNDYGKAHPHHEVLANIRFILMILYPIYLYFDERKYKDDKSK